MLRSSRQAALIKDCSNSGPSSCCKNRCIVMLRRGRHGPGDLGHLCLLDVQGVSLQCCSLLFRVRHAPAVRICSASCCATSRVLSRIVSSSLAKACRCDSISCCSASASANFCAASSSCLSAPWLAALPGLAHRLEEQPRQHRGQGHEVGDLEHKGPQAVVHVVRYPVVNGLAKIRIRAITRQKMAVDSTIARLTNRSA